MARCDIASGPDRPSRHAGILLIVLLLALSLWAAACGVGSAATPQPTPRLAPPTQVRTLRGMTFALTPYVFGAWPNPHGFFGPTVGPVRLHYSIPSSLAGNSPRDSTGVRVVVHHGKIYNMPVAQAQDGLELLARHRIGGGSVFLTLALREGQRLIDTHRTSPSTGSAWWFPYLFPFEEYGDRRLVARPPWYSGMAQGEVLDLFTQLYGITKAPKWRVAAAHVFASFLFPLRAGQATIAHPWVDRVIGRNLWIEEFPMPNPNDDTINGFGFALIGLTDYARAFHDKHAQLLAEAGLATWLHAIPRVRHPGGVMGYSRSHRMDRSSGYHRIVISQLRFLGAVTGDRQFGALATVFFDDFH